MITDAKTPLKVASLITVVVFIIGYSIFEARGLILGPIIKIEEPENGAGLTQSLTEIKGRVKNVSFVNLNDAPLAINEKGAFQEKLLLAPGLNTMEFKVKDRFGREKTLFLELFYTELNPV